MKKSLIACLLLIFVTTTMVMVSILLTRTHQTKHFFDSLKPEVDEKENVRRRDILGAISNPIKERDVYLSYLWEQYKNSSTSKRPKIVDEIHYAVTKVAYLDSRIDMIGWILFGPQRARSILRSIRDKKHPTVDDPPCLRSTLKLFEKHCGALIEHDMKLSLANVCNYVVDKKSIHEAILLACGMHNTESHGIDLVNPKIDITPSPIHGTFQYCGRVAINSISRMKVQSKYQVTVVPSDEKWQNRIRICFHRNDSLGLCQCEKDDWRSIQKGSWSYVMPDFEQRFVDVKFVTGISGFVTVSLEEVQPARGWYYVSILLILLFMAVSKWVHFCYTRPVVTGVLAAGMVHKWATRVLAVMCILMSFIDTPSPMVAVCSCLALCYVITSTLAPKLSTKTKLWHRSERPGQGTVNALGDGESTRRQLATQFVSFPKFKDWVIANAHRIKLCPDKA